MEEIKMSIYHSKAETIRHDSGATANPLRYCEDHALLGENFNDFLTCNKKLEDQNVF